MNTIAIKFKNRCIKTILTKLMNIKSLQLLLRIKYSRILHCILEYLEKKDVLRVIPSFIMNKTYGSIKSFFNKIKLDNGN